MTAQPLAATAISLVREALRTLPNATDPEPRTPAEEANEVAHLYESNAEWAQHYISVVGRLDHSDVVRLVSDLSRLGAMLARAIEPDVRELLLSMLAGETEAGS